MQDLVSAGVERRCARLKLLSEPVEWLTDNGPCFIAKDIRSLLPDIGLEPCETPARCPQSNGMVEPLVNSLKRDYVGKNPALDAETVMALLPLWSER